MARILYVDDDGDWRKIITRLLRNHEVNAVSSADEAMDLLSKASYAVALVDLNLRNDHDGEGGDLLEYLLLQHTETKRIAVTGAPPGGAMKRLIAQYGIEELIIKDREFSAPGLRRAVEEAIAAKPIELSRELRLNRWALRDRFRDWQRMQSDRITRDLSAAEDHRSKLKGMRGQAWQDAEDAIVSIRVRQRLFHASAERLREIVNNINSEADFDAALTALENAEEHFGDDGTGPGR